MAANDNTVVAPRSAPIVTTSVRYLTRPYLFRIYIFLFARGSICLSGCFVFCCCRGSAVLFGCGGLPHALRSRVRLTAFVRCMFLRLADPERPAALSKWRIYKSHPAPSRKGRVVNGQVPEASRKKSTPPSRSEIPLGWWSV